ncbi:hypothetical protein DSO57_1014465 [Entomophthora muscae]|uniref:Uncharacterized protein n=1 Tax=Entomophthora muscae TaxID=34485 RepID=A0ACC2RWH5_9FUNG|nr:hypothetical protein DSO57_1014465 [Entomophthora muscae]
MVVRLSWLTFLASSTGYLFLTREECLSNWVERSRSANPDYACAFFKRYQYVKQGNWAEFGVRFCGIYQFEGLCALKTCQGCIIARLGDGGPDNWRFDSNAFTRVGNRLYPNPQSQ